jgi:hypothetical protein
VADVTLSGWPTGATVNAYVAPTVPGVTALGASVTSGTAASDGTVDLTGLTAGVNYVASDGTTRRNFLIPTASSGTGEGLPEGASEGDVLTYESGEAVWAAPGAASVGAGDIGTTELAAGAVTAAKVAADVATQAELDAEAGTRAAADTALDGRVDTLEADATTQTLLDAEASTRAAADIALDGRVDTLENAVPAVEQNVFNGTSFPARPTATMVLWVGGGAADDPTADMEDGDVWFPSEA